MLLIRGRVVRQSYEVLEPRGPHYVKVENYIAKPLPILLVDPLRPMVS